MISEQQVLDILKEIKIDSGKNIVELGIVSSIIIKGQDIGFALNINETTAKIASFLENSCKKRLANVENIGKITIVLTSDQHIKNIKHSEAKNIRTKQHLAFANKIILVSSCKGGVGKSTVTVGIAKAMQQLNLKVGIVDADIFGPSIPELMQNKEKPAVENGKMIPLTSHGINFISIGNIIDAEKAAIWRGPMVTKSLMQLFLGVSWPTLDVILVDMPPGTGDVYLSLAENINIDTAIIVSTPQILAMQEVVKSVNMFEKLKINLLGMVTNMSYMMIDGRKIEPFGENTKKNFLELAQIEDLGNIPLENNILTNNFSDNIFLDISKKIWDKLNI